MKGSVPGFQRRKMLVVKGAVASTFFLPRLIRIRMKKCERLQKAAFLEWRKNVGGMPTWKEERRSLRWNVQFPALQVGPRIQTDRLIIGFQVRRSVKLSAVEGQEVNEVIPKIQSANETESDFLMCEVEEQQTARFIVQGRKEEKSYAWNHEKRTTVFVKELQMKTLVRNKWMTLGLCLLRYVNFAELYTGTTIDAVNMAFKFNNIGAMVTEEGGEAHTINLCKRCYCGMYRDCRAKSSSWQVMEVFWNGTI